MHLKVIIAIVSKISKFKSVPLVAVGCSAHPHATKMVIIMFYVNKLKKLPRSL